MDGNFIFGAAGISQERVAEKADIGLQEIFGMFLMIQRFCHILKHFLYSVHFYKILLFFFHVFALSIYCPKSIECLFSGAYVTLNSV